MSSGIPRVEDLLEITSNTCAQTEFVTNSAVEGGAVNRPFTFILKNLSDPSDADPCLAGLLIKTLARNFCVPPRRGNSSHPPSEGLLVRPVYDRTSAYSMH